MGFESVNDYILNTEFFSKLKMRTLYKCSLYNLQFLPFQIYSMIYSINSYTLTQSYISLGSCTHVLFLKERLQSFLFGNVIQSSSNLKYESLRNN